MSVFFGSIFALFIAALIIVGFAVLTYILFIPLLLIESSYVRAFNNSAVINEMTDINDLENGNDSNFGKFSVNSFQLKEKTGNKISSENINRDLDRKSLNNDSMYPEYGYFTQTKQIKKRAR